MLFKRARWIILLSISIITLVCIPLFTRGEFSTNVYGIYNFSIMYINMITNPIIWFFIIGAGVGIIYKSSFVIKNRLVCGVLILTSTVFVIWQYVYQYQANHGITLWGLSLTPWFFVLCICSKTIEIKTPKAFVFIGNISFSLYLCHMISLQIVTNTVSAISPSHNGLIYFLAMILLSMLMAYVSYALLELKLSNNVKKALDSIYLTVSLQMKKLINKKMTLHNHE